MKMVNQKGCLFAKKTKRKDSVVLGQPTGKFLVFLISGYVFLLLLHLLGCHDSLLINLTLGHFPSGFALRLLLLLALLLGGLSRTAVDSGLVAVALPDTPTYGGARIADACSNAGLLPFQEFPAERHRHELDDLGRTEKEVRYMP